MDFFSSYNELFAIKKNVGEDAKLRNKINSLSLDHEAEHESIQQNIRENQKSLKDIKLSTGYSSEGVPTSGYRRSQLSGRNSTAPFWNSRLPNEIPSIYLDEVFLEETENDRKSAKPLQKHFWKRRALTSVTHADVDNFKHMKLHKRRVKSDGAAYSISVDNLPKLLSRRKSSLSSFQSSSLPNVNLSTSEKLNEDIVSTRIVQMDSEPEKAEKQKALIRRRYNPWNIQYASGAVYNGLSLPHIKDCSRPMCRPNCTTCLSRKLKTPCLLIPGLTCPHGYVQDSESDSDNVDDLDENKSKKGKLLKKRAKHKDKEQQNNVRVENVETRGQNNEEGGLEGEENDSLKLEASPKVARKVNKERLKELATPKGGYSRNLQYSKTFIKREVEKLQKRDPLVEFWEIEKSHSHDIQSKIQLFLSMANGRDDNAIPNKMVDIPHRDDIMQVDISHIDDLPLPVTFPFNTKKKVYFRH